MRPVIVEGINGVLRAPEGQEDSVFDLPVKVGNGYVASCWHADWRDRLRILFHGNVWLSIQGNTHPPLKLYVESVRRVSE